MSLCAIVGDRDVPVIYSRDGDCFGIGKSSCPFPAVLGVHDTSFYLEDVSSCKEISQVEVIEVTRRYVWWCVRHDNMPEEDEEETASEEDETEYEESLWGSSDYPEG